MQAPLERALFFSSLTFFRRFTRPVSLAAFETSSGRSWDLGAITALRGLDDALKLQRKDALPPARHGLTPAGQVGSRVLTYTRLVYYNLFHEHRHRQNSRQ